MKPCKFCGGSPYVWDTSNFDGDGAARYFVSCGKCTATTSKKDGYATQKAAETAWENGHVKEVVA